MEQWISILIFIAGIVIGVLGTVLIREGTAQDSPQEEGFGCTVVFIGILIALGGIGGWAYFGVIP